MATSTPWGASQSSEKITRGINYYSTASHGGFILSEGMNKRIPEYARNDNRAYEEDSEWAIVVTFFPKYFELKERKRALFMLRNWHPTIYETYYNVVIAPGDSYIKDAQAAKEKNKNNFVVTAAWGDWHENVPSGMVGVIAMRDADKADGKFLVPSNEYNSGSLFVIDESRHAAWAGIR